MREGRWLHALVALASLAVVAGCTVPSSTKALPAEDRALLGRLALVPVQCAPEVVINVTQGRVHGVGKGAAAGTLIPLQIGVWSQDIHILLLGALLTPVTAVVGAVYGVVASDSAEHVADRLGPIKTRVAGTEFQGLLRQEVAADAAARTSQTFVASDVQGTISWREPKPYLLTPGLDTVVEIGLQEIRIINFWVSNKAVTLQLKGVVRLIRVTDGTQLLSHEYSYLSEKHSLDDWARDGGSLTGEELQRGLRHIAVQIVNDIFLASPELTDPQILFRTLSPQTGVSSLVSGLITRVMFT